MGYKVKKIYQGSNLVWPVPKTQHIVISASLSPSWNTYALGLTGVPKKFTITYTSYHESGWADQVIGIGYDGDNNFNFNCGDGYNFSYDRCWLGMKINNTEYHFVQNKYQGTGTWQTVLTFSKDGSISVQQGTGQRVSGGISSAQLSTYQQWFNDYQNLRLCVGGTRSYLTSDVVIDVEY